MSTNHATHEIEDQQENDGRPAGPIRAARAVGSGTVSFGLVSIPIKTYVASSAEGVRFNMLHAACGTRLGPRGICPFCRVTPERSATVRGYEHAPEQWLAFTDEDLRKLEAEKTDRIDIVEFIPEESLDFIYIRSTRYLGPDRGGDRAFKLIADAMDRTERIAIAWWGARGREQLVALRPYKGGLLLHVLYFEDQVRAYERVDYPGKLEFKKVEEELADKLIGQLSSDRFRPERYHDQWLDRFSAAVEQKASGAEPPPAPEGGTVIDLFEALRRRLEPKGGR